jgi:hypothetical protein
MTEVKAKKDPFEPPGDKKNPLLEKESKGKSSGVSHEMFKAIVSSRLEMVPPNLDPSTSPEKQDDPNPSRQDGVEPEDESWFRFFVTQRLAIDPPPVDPSTPEDSQPGEYDSEVQKSNDIPGLRAARIEEVNSLSSLENEYIENPTDQSEGNGHNNTPFVRQTQPFASYPDNGNHHGEQIHDLRITGKNEGDHKDSIPVLVPIPDLSIENEVGSNHRRLSEILSKLAIHPKNNTGWLLASVFMFVAVIVGGWKLTDFTSRNSLGIDAKTASIQLKPSDILSAGDNHGMSLEDLNNSMMVKSSSVSPEVTPTPTIYDRSVFTQIQKDRLYKASLAYLADNEEDAVYIAKRIEYVPNEGHPATMCGPLVVSILRDASLIDRYVDIEKFWFLNPRDEYTVRAILEKYFPREHYHWYQTSTPIHYFDFRSYPLYTGDFIYLFAGSGGTYEHMLLVTRTDEAGRAYSVSPQETANGYSIKEVMLYDPNHPGEGYFYEITNKANAEFGLTGFGGFRMWRRLTPIPERNLNDLTFGDEIDSILDKVGGEWHVYIKKIGGRVIHSRMADEIIHPASVIKVPLAIQFFQALDYQGDDLHEYLSQRGEGGRTYQQLLQAMLVESEEKATQIIENSVNDRLNVNDTFAKWGVLETSFSPRRTTAEEMGRIFEGLYQGEWIKPEEQEIILELLSEFASSDDTRLGVIRNELSVNEQFFNKRGSLFNGRIVVADVAIIENGDDTFIIALFGFPGSKDEAPTYDDLEAAIEDVAPVIWEYLRRQ